MKKYLATILAIGLIVISTGCGFRTLGATEYGVVFSALPRFFPSIFRGGVRDKVLQPGEMEFLFPWERLYRLDSSVQSISWGGVGQGDDKRVEDYVETRSLDGNEVGLAITVHFHVIPEKALDIVQFVGAENEKIRDLVTAVARADIRTHMNVLKTRDFFSPVKRQAAVDQVKKALNTRLNPEGINVESVIYNDHRFERRLADGGVDRTYQEQIDETQSVNQETEQEGKKVAAVVERKRQEFNEAQARVNRIVEEAQGLKRQATLRGDAYLEAKQNEAKQIEAVGLAEVAGLKKQIEALSGPGGKSLLRLSLVKEILKSDPRFVLINSPEGGQNNMGFDFNRLDTNRLLSEAGVFAEVGKEIAETPAPKKPAAEKATTPADM